MTTTYILETGSTFDGTEITSGTDWSFSESGSEVNFVSDGHRKVDLVCVDGIKCSISINCTDQSLSLFKAVGSAGALVLKSKLRGDGSATSTVKTYTFAKAALISVTANTSNDGGGSLSFNFSAWVANGSGAIYAIS